MKLAGVLGVALTVERLHTYENAMSMFCGIIVMIAHGPLILKEEYPEIQKMMEKNQADRTGSWTLASLLSIAVIDTVTKSNLVKKEFI